MPDFNLSPVKFNVTRSRKQEAPSDLNGKTKDHKSNKDFVLVSPGIEDLSLFEEIDNCCLSVKNGGNRYR
jgi:hypothetical protein